MCLIAFVLTCLQKTYLVWIPPPQDWLQALNSEVFHSANSDSLGRAIAISELFANPTSEFWANSNSDSVPSSFSCSSWSSLSPKSVSPPKFVCLFLSMRAPWAMEPDLLLQKTSFWDEGFLSFGMKIGMKFILKIRQGTGLFCHPLVLYSLFQFYFGAVKLANTMVAAHLTSRCRVEICRDRHDRRSCKICASCVNFPGKHCNFSHNLCRTTRFTHTNCDFAL